MGFSKQEYWSGSPFPIPGDLPHPGIQPGSPALQADSLRLSYQGSSIKQNTANLMKQDFMKAFQISFFWARWRMQLAELNTPTLHDTWVNLKKGHQWKTSGTAFGSSHESGCQAGCGHPPAVISQERRQGGWKENISSTHPKKQIQD